MKTGKVKCNSLLILALVSLFFSGCKDDDEITAPTQSITYKTDGRTVSLDSPLPIVLDLSGDGQVDFTIFLELTANSKGDRMYAGVNPIGSNRIKSGPSNSENFLNMGLLIAESIGSTINMNLEPNEQWTSEHSALVIRNTLSNGKVFYEGNWSDSRQIVGIQNNINGILYFGWLRIEFDKKTESITLIDYAYNMIANESITTGAKSNQID